MLDHDGFKYYILIIFLPIMVVLDINSRTFNRDFVPSKVILREIEL